ncbi:MAG: 4-hydroxy-tetrahydrodipicolinate reductase [Elusimicrobia bacterium CG06_land_8_20_14_3_00_38_11]|nr:MAG: 4-hydroxy-tetrahydrodipicolinate reductase [Elusimicrobia bacterium CG06_land_8_20_14_3_00_38_11]
MIKIVVCGAAGKMGKMVISRILADKELVLSGAIEWREHHAVGQQIDEINITDNFSEALKLSDVAIDFTNMDATLFHLDIAKKQKKPIIIGTTGITDEGVERIKNASTEIPIILAANMSVGVNLLFKLVEEVAVAIPGYDVEIVEAHHNQKKDAPSGTAIKIAEILKTYKKKIVIHSIRAGDIVGEHTVIFAGNGERLELIHRAHTRDTFAAGAVKAAKWLFGKKPGLYTMRDVLGL